MQTLNTHRLRVLREVAARGTIAAAAEALNLTGPAISHQIGTLERELGVALFERTSRSLRLTEAGRRMVRHADKIMADCEAAVADVESLSVDVSGTVLVSILETTANPGYMLLKERAQHPGLKVILVSMDPADALLALRTGEIDIALSNEWGCLPAPPSMGTTRFDLMTESYNVVLPQTHPLANAKALHLRDLAHEPWCVTREQGFLDALRLTMRAAGFAPDVAVKSFNSRAITLAAEAGIGVGVIPISADTRGSDVALVPLIEPALTRYVFALVRSGSEKSPHISVALDGLKEGVAERPLYILRDKPTGKPDRRHE